MIRLGRMGRGIYFPICCMATEKSSLDTTTDALKITIY